MPGLVIPSVAVQFPVTAVSPDSPYANARSAIPVVWLLRTKKLPSR